MQPKTARAAIAITIITALLIIAVCVCMLMNYNPFLSHTKQQEAEMPVENEAHTGEKDHPQVTVPPTPAPTPGPEDLKGASDNLYTPKPENYLSEYMEMIVYSDKNEPIYLLYRPEKKEFMKDVIIELEINTPVLGIAKENGFTLVVVDKGLAGWIPTQDLDVVG